MARVEVRRHVVADPTSVALLLAEPVADKDQHSGIVVSPPRRTGIGFASTIEVTDSSGQQVGGHVTVRPSVDAGADLVAVITAADSSQGRAAERAVTAYLARLASRARFRASAA